MFVLPVAKIRMESLPMMSESTMQLLECCSGSWKFWCKKVRKSREVTPKMEYAVEVLGCQTHVQVAWCVHAVSEAFPQTSLIPLESEEGWCLNTKMLQHNCDQAGWWQPNTLRSSLFPTLRTVTCLFTLVQNQQLLISLFKLYPVWL